jgi:hypothetical protein
LHTANKKLWLAGIFGLLLAIAAVPAIANEPATETAGFQGRGGMPGQACGQPPSIGFAAVQAGAERVKSGPRTATNLVPARSIDLERPAQYAFINSRQTPTPAAVLSRAHSGRAPPTTNSL